MLFHGPPGVPKTMLAERVPGLLPDLDFHDALELAELDGLSASADQELRQAEDALVALMEQQAKRDALYAESREELKRKYEFGRMGDVA